MNENHYNCIYMYINKTNGKRYIGQAKDFNKRYKTHIIQSKNEKKRDYKYPFHKAIRKYGIKNFEVIILKENLSSQCLLNLFECYYIKKYNTLCKNKCGYNVSNGGHNGSPYAGKTKDEMIETRKKHSKTMIENGTSKGKNHPLYGKNRSKETKQKISETMIINGTSKGINHPMARKVVQYDLNMNIIKIWDYIKQAGEELNIERRNISACCIGKRKTCGGYIWKYYDEVINDEQ